MTEQRLTDDRYCLFCEKAGHRSDECHSTHALSGPRARELSRLAHAAILSADRGEPVAHEYRWTNPGDYPHQESRMQWKPVEPGMNQTIELKIEELRAYRYDGKPCYEVRALYTSAPSTPQPAPEQVPVETLLEWAVLDGVVRLSKVMDADLQDALRKFAGRFGATPQPAPEFAWLIEWKSHGHGPQWWGFNYTPGKHADWCSDANNAVRFSRKEDAERMRLHIIAVTGFKGQHAYEKSVSVTEHAWPALATLQPSRLHDLKESKE